MFCSFLCVSCFIFIFISLCTLMSVEAAVGLDILLQIKQFLYSFYMSILCMIWLNKYKIQIQCLTLDGDEATVSSIVAKLKW